MLTLFFPLARTFVLGLLVFFALTGSARALSHYESSETIGRRALKKHLSVLAQYSQSTPLVCEEKAYGNPKWQIAYQLSLSDEPEYQDAYFIAFSSTDQSRKWSTLIAYEGKQGWIMGGLNVVKRGEVLLYRHSFRGFYNDVTEVLADNNGPRELRYLKLLQGSPVVEIKCPL
jgi:hypothetical protein